MEKLLDVAKRQDVEKLTSIKQIGGEKSAKLYIDALNNPAMQERIASLASYGLAMEEKEEAYALVDESFSGQVWCVTGSFEHFNPPRSKAMDEVLKRGGGRTVSAVTSKTTHLLAGSGGGGVN